MEKSSDELAAPRRKPLALTPSLPSQYGRAVPNEIPFQPLSIRGLNPMGRNVSVDREIRTEAVDFSFGEIVNLHLGKEIIISPEYQRLFRWSDEQKSRLIESILIQLPIPPVFFIENEDGVLELIDGLQRISSVIQFISPDAIARPPLKLIGCDLISDLNGKFFDDLTLTDRLRIKRTPIRAIIIRKQGGSYIKYELFKRLNTGGSLLSAQEIRNCSSRMVEGGERFYKVIQALSKFGSFTKATSKLPETAISEKGDEELVLRFFAVKNYLHGYHGNVQEWLDSYMEAVLFNEEPFHIDAEQKLFKRVFDVIHEKFGDAAFVRYRDGQASGRLAPAYFEAVIGGILANIENVSRMQSLEIKKKLGKLFESKSFRDVTGPGANTIEKLNKRISLVANLFSAK